ncbi:hypothetical protein CSE16_19350 [Solibacillus sp. R5-41]|uniref:hypothetical protein n=1 Tax=Solibacillus sp. R5-41 TaxID=2048654 RepID=UPI000C12802F|nr:hypothetical protein [Solibacillus sp. R5-41]ATP42000.1 hypothetical protein CSE16_19350 [Solibacillus sp. R5-41]
MRTSRISGTTSSVYRNNARAVHSDIQFADAMNGGMHDHFRDPREQLQKHKGKKNKAAPKAKKLVQNKARLIVKGMQYNANSAITLNQLFQRSTKVNAINKLQRRNTTYQTSI